MWLSPSGKGTMDADTARRRGPPPFADGDGEFPEDAALLCAWASETARRGMASGDDDTAPGGIPQQAKSPSSVWVALARDLPQLLAGFSGSLPLASRSRHGVAGGCVAVRG